MNASVPSEPTSSRRKISTGVVGVEEGAEPVAGRVLDLELAPDPLARAPRRRGSRRGSRASPAASSGSAAAKRSLGVRRGGVDHRPRRRARRSASARCCRSRRRRRSASRRSCWRPPRRRRRCRCYAGSGPSLRPYGASTRLAWPSTVPGAHPRARRRRRRPRPRAKWRRTSTRMPSLWAWPLRLVPPARRVTGIARAAAVGEHLGDVVGVAGHHHRLRDQPVGAGVGGVADEVERPGRAPGRRRAARSARRAAAPGVPPASSSGTRSARRRSSGRSLGRRERLDGFGRRAGAISASHRAPHQLEEPHPGRHPDLDQLGPSEAIAARSASRSSSRSLTLRERTP